VGICASAGGLSALEAFFPDVDQPDLILLTLEDITARQIKEMDHDRQKKSTQDLYRTAQTG